MGTLWLRAETRKEERRAPLSPRDAENLIKSGHSVVVEDAFQRCISIDEYASIGCTVAARGSWPVAPSDAIILGLKSFDITEPLKHRHVFFSHFYNSKRVFLEKRGASDLIRAMSEGGGQHYDLEFLTDRLGIRVAAFGHTAGYIGAAFGLLVWCHRRCQLGDGFSLPEVNEPTLALLRDQVSKLLEAIVERPSVVVVGARGRCGHGAVRLLEDLRISPVRLGRNDTGSKKVVDVFNSNAILLNCISADEQSGTLLSFDDISPCSLLDVIVDIGCETSGNNPFALRGKLNTFDEPSTKLPTPNGSVELIAIDNLPSYTSVESSDSFSAQMLPHYHTVLSNNGDLVPWRNAATVWHRASKLILQMSQKEYDDGDGNNPVRSGSVTLLD